MKNYVVFKDPIYKFTEYFNLDTGFYVRTESKETNEDPFMRSFPVLLDIGIMGGCKSCKLCNVDCYQGGKPYDPSKDMKLEDYKRIIDEGFEKGLQQVALGGAGNPNDHKNFEEILKYTRDKDIVPNYTTSGINLSDEAVKLTKEYCGAVAVSWYRQDFTVEALEKFLGAGMKTSIHFVLSKDSIEEAIRCINTGKLVYYHKDEIGLEQREFDLNEKGINAIIFLLYKPVGLGIKNKVLTIKDDEYYIKLFFESISNSENLFKIGFDSCSVPAVLNYSDFVDKASIDTCEGGRFSAYINADMIMTPCSFDQSLKYGVQLNSNVTIEDAWNSDNFSRFRQKLQFSCLNCPDRCNCYGGCPLTNEIVLCKSKMR